MILDFKTLNSAQENGDIEVTMYYYNYIVLILITILLIFLLLKYSVTGQQRGGGNSFKSEAIFLFGITGIVIGYTFSTIFIGLIWGSYIFKTKKQEWHNV